MLANHITVCFSYCIPLHANHYSHGEKEAQSLADIKHISEQFGREAKNYSTGRRGYGDAIYDYLAKIIKSDATILDMVVGLKSLLENYVLTALTIFKAVMWTLLWSLKQSVVINN